MDCWMPLESASPVVVIEIMALEAVVYMRVG